MVIEIEVPQQSPGELEAVIDKWLKKSGDYVSQGDPLVELETERGTYVIEAPQKGVLKVLAQEGETVRIEQVIGIIEDK